MTNRIRLPVVTLTLCAMLTGVSKVSVETIAQRNAPVAIGEIAPDFTLSDQNRHKVSLSRSRGKSPIILVFYRGYW